MELFKSAPRGSTIARRPGSGRSRRTTRGSSSTSSRDTNWTSADPESTDEVNPWRGLRSYDEAQASLFFGRSQFVARLADRVKSQPLTIVLGASGTGKSSVVKAGLLACLRSREPDSWSIVPPFRPGKSPLAALVATALPGEASDADHIARRNAVSETDPAALARRFGD